MKFAVVLAASLLIAVSAPALAQHDHSAGGGDVGSDSVSFVTSCAPALRPDFNRAVALLHSFWFAQAIVAFEGVAAKDPSCAMAHWGIALSRWGNPFAGLRCRSRSSLGGPLFRRRRPQARRRRASARSSPRLPSFIPAPTRRRSERAPLRMNRRWSVSSARILATWKRGFSMRSR